MATALGAVEGRLESSAGDEDSLTPRSRTRKKLKGVAVCTKKMALLQGHLDAVEEDSDALAAAAEWQELRKIVRELSLHYSMVAKSTKQRTKRTASAGTPSPGREPE